MTSALKQNINMKDSEEISKDDQEESTNILPIEMRKVISKKINIKKMKKRVLGEIQQEMSKCHEACNLLHDLIGELNEEGGR